MHRLIGFLKTGLFLALFGELALNTRVFFEGLWLILPVYFCLLCLVWVFDEKFVRGRLGDARKEAVFYWAFFGVLGLCGEWFFLGKTEEHFLVQFFMLSFWMGVFVMPRMMTDPAVSQGFAESVREKLGFQFGTGVFAAVALFLAFGVAGFSVGVVLFYFSLHHEFSEYFSELS